MNHCVMVSYTRYSFKQDECSNEIYTELQIAESTVRKRVNVTSLAKPTENLHMSLFYQELLGGVGTKKFNVYVLHDALNLSYKLCKHYVFYVNLVSVELSLSSYHSFRSCP